MRISDWSSDVCSSDLAAAKIACLWIGCALVRRDDHCLQVAALAERDADRQRHEQAAKRTRGCDLRRAAHVSSCPGSGGTVRSEEHTSELQSLMRISYAVFCLKKKTYTTSTILTYADTMHT